MNNALLDFVISHSSKLTERVIYELLYNGMKPMYSPVHIDVESVWDVKNWGAIAAVRTVLAQKYSKKKFNYKYLSQLLTLDLQDALAIV